VHKQPLKLSKLDIIDNSSNKKLFGLPSFGQSLEQNTFLIDKIKFLSKLYHYENSGLDIRTNSVIVEVEWEWYDIDRCTKEKTHQIIDFKSICSEPGFKKDNEILTTMIFEQGTVELQMTIDDQDGF